MLKYFPAVRSVLNPSLTTRIGNRLSRYLSRWTLRGNTVECLCCGWCGSRFCVRPPGVCPKCGSWERHRFFAYLIGHVIDRQELRSKSLLEFAPWMNLEPLLQKTFKRRTTADIAKGGVDLHLDICKLDIPDNSFDVVMAFHVLEHVDSDICAMRELHRVLSPNGVAILCVPVTVEETQEVNDASPAHIKEVACYPEHVRACGVDYPERLTKVGFDVQVFDPRAFPDHDRERFGITPPQRLDGAIYYCRKRLIHRQ